MELRLIQYGDLESTYDEPERIARFAGAIDSRQDERTVLLGSGDNIAPGAISLLTGGEQAIEFFSAIEPDADTLGNHDFDYGQETLLSVVRNSPQQWLCANVSPSKFGAKSGIRPWTIIERAGYRIGIFGLAHPNTDSKAPGAGSLTFTNPIEAATRVTALLRERGVDHVVCLSHLGEEEGHGQGEVDDLAKSVEIDVICGGHTHGNPRIDRVEGTLLVRTAGTGRDINEIRFDGEWTATRHRAAEAPQNREIEERFRAFRTSTGLDEVLTTISRPIERSEAERVGGESRLGNFVTDAYRWGTDADISLQHGAGLRGGPDLIGDVTLADLVSVVPFDMVVPSCEISGASLLDMLTYGGEIHYPAKPMLWHIHLSGGTVTFDYEERALVSASVDSEGRSPSGNRPTAGDSRAERNEVPQAAGRSSATKPGDGEAIDPDATYAVAAPENLLRTFDVNPERRAAGLQYELLAEYAEQNGISPSLDGRITLLNR